MIDQDLQSLIEGCVAEDRVSQRQVYEMYYSKMLGVCMRYTKDLDQAKDLLQDGFIKVFAKVGKFNQEGSFEGWIRRIVVNTCIDHFRRQRNEFVLVDNDSVLEQYSGVDEDEDDSSQYEFKASQVIEAMQYLSPAYRTIFNLYVFENLQHKEIAKRLDITIGTSKSNLAKAKKNLKKILLKEFKNADG
ncbi:MAG: RNA polymerase sigma factor [Flavobacteriales bacterium]|nr:RNA polymerase sigma factor [Flavobacteriales bacterium]